MASSSSSPSFSSSFLPRSRPSSTRRRTKQRAPTLISMASAPSNEAHDPNFYRNGRRGLVDENLIVLRKRLHEMKMMERNYEPPSDWMEWEKNCYAGYDEFVCEAMGFLQAKLMDTRPCLALGMVALVGLSVPASIGLLLFHLMEMSREVLAAVHLIT
ncbi:uncharacterized protein LOC127810194 [Diospyros lotus]|uniref:uncharacterized protein LOC127810194 n=1 Tax=Diospyros lotus TaxID=55363 RepID=UPI002250D7D5|nr:uncharacterized protein LOC127810194 [Diospyros lotus]